MFTVAQTISTSAPLLFVEKDIPSNLVFTITLSDHIVFYYTYLLFPLRHQGS